PVVSCAAAGAAPAVSSPNSKTPTVIIRHVMCVTSLVRRSGYSLLPTPYALLPTPYDVAPTAVRLNTHQLNDDTTAISVATSALATDPIVGGSTSRVCSSCTTVLTSRRSHT